MSSSVRATSVRFDEDSFWVDLSDGRTLGVPLAWFINNLWLELIAYRTEISFGVIISGVGILLVLGAITIGSQTVRAAFANPAENLKNE